MKFLFVVALIINSSLVLAHPGRTDSDGGHSCKTKCIEKWNLEYGSYHMHTTKKDKTSPKVRIEARKEGRKAARQTG